MKQIPILGDGRQGRGETADLEPVARFAAEAKERSRLLPNTQKDRLLGKAYMVEGMKNRQRERSGPVVSSWVCSLPHSSPSLPVMPPSQDGPTCGAGSQSASELPAGNHYRSPNSVRNQNGHRAGDGNPARTLSASGGTKAATLINGGNQRARLNAGRNHT